MTAEELFGRGPRERMSFNWGKFVDWTSFLPVNDPQISDLPVKIGI